MSLLHSALEDIDTPNLIVDFSIFEANMNKMLELCRKNGVSLRPHAKTHRTPELGLAQVDLGADGLCVAKLGEAEGFVAAGVKNLTVAYPVLGEYKLKRALALSEQANLTLAADSLEGVLQLSNVFSEADKKVKVLLIINTGLNRDGVLPKDAGSVAKEIDRLPGCTFEGIMTHEGSAYAAESQEDLKIKSIKLANQMLDAAQKIEQVGVRVNLISMGASASAKFVAQVPGINQIRPGIFAFNDLGQIALGNAEFFDCAATVLSTVVSKPSATRAIIDAGSKSLSKDLIPTNFHSTQFSGHGYIIDHPGWEISRLSEEHGILEWRESNVPSDLKIGSKIQIIPNHICTVFSSLNESTIIKNGEIVSSWRALGPGASR